MREFRTMSLADQVFEKLENDIILGVYQRGEILTELKLVELLGVSRTPIREALRRLEMERLIEDSGKGSGHHSGRSDRYYEYPPACGGPGYLLCCEPFDPGNA